MATIVHLAPGAEAISEFARQSSGAYLTATCVETAALMCLCGVKPVAQVAPAAIGNYLQGMVNAWRAADPNVSAGGASNYGDATNWLRGQGATVDENIIGDGDWWAELQRGCASGYTYLVGVTNAQGLPGDEQGVHNHGLAGLGIDDAGNIVCGDPDNWAANDHMPGNPVGDFVTYTRQDFLNGQISSLTRIHPMANIPSGWRDDGTTLTAPNSVPVVKGFRDYVLNHQWDNFNLPLHPEYGANPMDPEAPSVGAGTRQDFREGSLGWTPSMGVARVWVGDELLALRAQVAALIAAAHNPPPPPPPDPAGVKAEAQVKAIAAILAQ
jgi:hypothetical protein